MCHDHDAHFFSTTIRQKKQGRLCQKNRADYAGKNDGKATETKEKGTCMDKKETKVKKMGETDDSGYHRGQENVIHSRSQIVFAFVSMEQSSVSAW